MLQQDDTVNCNNSCAGIHVLERMMMTMVVLLLMMMMMTNARILPRMGQDHFLTNILQFISHRDAIIRRCMVFDVEFVLQ
jgi:hypothetical protein